MSVLFSLRDVGMQYDGTTVLAGVSLDFRSAEFAAIIGPNGAGKSTLLGIMAGLRRGSSGTCDYSGTPVSRWNRLGFARRVAFLPQSVRMEFPFTAEQVVLMGRTPHCDGLFESPADWDAVERAMAVTDTLPFRRRDFRSLSGGERQRVILASAVAQQPEALLLDEPTTFLDLKHQVGIYRVLRDLARQGMLVIAVTHDLNLAGTFAGRIIALHGGRVAADDVPQNVLAPDLVHSVFGVAAEVHRTSDGRTWMLYGE